MMKLICILIQAALVGVVAYCGWRGFKNGIVLGVLSVAALALSLFAADMAADAYCSEFQGMLEPFSAGLVDTAISAVTDYDPATADPEDEVPAVVLSATEKRDVEMVCYAACRQIGFADGAARGIAGDVAGKVREVSQDMNSRLASTLCLRAAWLVLFLLGFLLLAIILAAVGNIFNLVFALPERLEIVDALVGMLVGVAKGYLLLLVLGCLLRYAGMVIPDAIEKNTPLLQWLVNTNLIADLFGI